MNPEMNKKTQDERRKYVKCMMAVLMIDELKISLENV
jgi:hypothetical protein